MSLPITSHKKADIFSIILFVIGLVAVSYLRIWWPYMILVFGSSLILRQYLRGRFYDLMLTVLVFGGMFLFYATPINRVVIMPVIFVCGAITILFQEYFIYRKRVGAEEVEDTRLEIDDEQHER